MLQAASADRRPSTAEEQQLSGQLRDFLKALRQALQQRDRNISGTEWAPARQLLESMSKATTAVSEIARNAFRYAGGGKVEYGVDTDAQPEVLTIRVTDKGPGIADLNRILVGLACRGPGLCLGKSSPF